MGQPVVHFEIIGKDGEALHEYYSELFGWTIDANNPMNYGMVAREGNVNADGVGIGGGIGGYPDVEAALAKAESLGGTRIMGPDTIMDQVELGQFADPEGHVIGVVRTLS